LTLGGRTLRGDAPLCVAASRSALVRLAPVVAALAAREARPRVAGLTDALDLHVPPRTLESFARAPECVATAVEAAIVRRRPSVAIIAGDSDAAVLCAVVAARHGVPIARLGAGLRSGDREMGDEINRIVLDAMAQRLYTDDWDACQTVLQEGAPEADVITVGSTLPDVVARWRRDARERALWRRLGLAANGYVLVALNRHENLVAPDQLAHATTALLALAGRLPVALCLDPATRTTLESAGVLRRLAAAGAIFTGPLGYVDFLSLELGAGAVVTDSSGVQEETTILGVPCFTWRRASERSATLTHGTNVLIGDDGEGLEHVVLGPAPDEEESLAAGDGCAGRRIGDDLVGLIAA
jgi:UDP-N-acetylglucosamine 2-epimerase (non-hydrolysing)